MDCTTANQNLQDGSPRYWEVADELIGNRHAYRATRGRPCPVCGHPDWCLVGEHAVICARADSGVKRYGDYGWLILLDGDLTGLAPAPNRTPAPAPKLSIDEVTRLANRMAAGANLTGLSSQLGTPVWTLQTLGVGRGEIDGSWCWTIPERDAGGDVIGLQRRFDDGSKRHVRGSRRGLTFSLDTFGRLQHAYRVLIVEGASDTAAGLSIIRDSQNIVIGRPSNTGGVAMLAELLADVPDEAEIIVIGERDEKPDGTWPGRDGAISTARRLAEQLGRGVSWSMPPGEAKDTRDWLTHYRGDNLARESAFFSGLYPQEVEVCSRSSIEEIPAYRATGTAPPILPIFSGFDCRRATVVIQRNRHDEHDHRGVVTACRSRSCSVCRKTWEDRHRLWYEWLFRRAGRIWLAETDRQTWKTTYRRIRRSDPEACYVAVEVLTSKLMVFVTSPIDGTLEITADEACTLFADAIRNARPVSKPVVCSKAWRIGAGGMSTIVDKTAASDKASTTVDTDRRGEKCTTVHTQRDVLPTGPPPPDWETVRRGRRTTWKQFVGALQTMGVEYQTEHVRPVGSMVYRWRLPEGTDAEAWYGDLLTAQLTPMAEPSPNDVMDFGAMGFHDDFLET